jgi:hypothetical protein
MTPHAFPAPPVHPDVVGSFLILECARPRAQQREKAKNPWKT